MSSSLLHRVLENFAWRVEAITPTLDAGRKFRRVDKLAYEVNDTSGTFRRFWVMWNGSGSDENVTDGSARVSVHEIELGVIYPTASTRDWHALQAIVVQDRHDLISHLQNRNLAGFSAASPSTDIGLYTRERASDDVDRDESLWVLTLEWRCTVYEESY